jgi:peptidoglycan hydrolase-like protein with peptidoglycan-binding domain
MRSIKSPLGAVAAPAGVALAGVFVIVFAGSAAASTHMESASIQPAPIPGTGWHGRPIQRPGKPVNRASLGSPSYPAGWSAGLVKFGTGYHRLGGSDRVREVQRRLTRLGYHTGPVDGLYGPLTRSAVQWFQIKHGLRSTGVVAATTLATLRHRMGVAGTGRAKAKHGSTSKKVENQAVAGARQQAGKSTSSGSASLLVPLLVGLGVLTMAGSALALGTRRRRRVGWLPEPLLAEGWSANPAVGPFNGQAVAVGLVNGGPGRGADPAFLVEDPRHESRFWVSRPEITRLEEPNRERSRLSAIASHVPEPGITVLGYVSEQNRQAAEPHQSAIAEACERFGWTLERVVLDLGQPAEPVLSRPGLTYALEQLTQSDASRLVVDRLEHLALSPWDLRTVLDLFAGAEVALTALDVGLDTATAEGKVTTRTVMAVTGPHNGAGATAPAAVRRGRRDEVAARMRRMRESGMSLRAIADQLNTEGVPTLRGGAQWRASTVQSMLRDRSSGAASTPTDPTGGSA